MEPGGRNCGGRDPKAQRRRHATMNLPHKAEKYIDWLSSSQGLEDIQFTKEIRDALVVMGIPGSLRSPVVECPLQSQANCRGMLSEN